METRENESGKCGMLQNGKLYRVLEQSDRNGGKTRMKVMFDSEDEKEDFIRGLSDHLCPRYLGLGELQRCDSPIDCRKCWEKAVEMEVKQ